MALRCSSPPIDATLPLFGNSRQVWQLCLRVRTDVEDLQPLVDRAFQAWLGLIPGTVGRPEIIEQAQRLIDVDLPVVASAPDELATPAPIRFVLVEFDYLGSSAELRWPSFSQNRRARQEPLCPVPPLAAFPVVVYEPTDMQGSRVLEPRSPVLPDDDFDLGLPQLPSIPKLVGAAKVVAGVAVVGGILYLFSQMRSSRE